MGSTTLTLNVLSLSKSFSSVSNSIFVRKMFVDYFVLQNNTNIREHPLIKSNAAEV
jgi:hypothetical protein